ncbi:hypothetical protein PInf_022087 [Phytophthora infestans]|nr:hypothetical protein PInf_022087 [Phytophthora infestans]
MRLCYIVTVVTTIAFFAEGSSVTSQSNVRYPGKTDPWKVDEEERGMGLEKVLSQKTLSLKKPLLTKSMSVVDLSKIDDEAFLQALNKGKHDLFKEIEKMGYTPKSMKETMIARKGNAYLDTGDIFL